MSASYFNYKQTQIPLMWSRVRKKRILLVESGFFSHQYKRLNYIIGHLLIGPQRFNNT